MGLEHTLFAQMSEEFSPRHIFHEDVKTAWVLSDSFEINLRQATSTIKVWFIELSILYSLDMWSTCCALIISSLFIILTQEYRTVFFFLTKRTLPNEPNSLIPYPRLQQTSNHNLWYWQTQFSSPTFLIILWANYICEFISDNYLASFKYLVHNFNSIL